MQTRIFASILAAALAGASVAALAGPEQDFEAAFKAGRPLSADAAYRELAKANGRVRPILHFQAATVAEELGNTSARNDRWTLYVRREQSWTKEVEFVLWRLCSTGVDVELYARLAGNSKPSDSLWTVGYDMFWRLREQRRQNEMLRLCGVMLGKFQDSVRRAQAIRMLAENIQNCGPEFPRKELRDLVLRTPGLGETDGFRRLLFWGNQRDAFNVAFPLEYMARHKDAKVSDDVLDWSLRYLDDGSIDRLDPEKDKEKVALRDQVVKLSKELRDRLLSGDSPLAAKRYMWASGCRLPAQFYPGWKKDAPAPGLADVVRRVYNAKAFAAAEAQYRNEFFGWVNWLVENKRFDEKDTAEFKALSAAKAPKKPDWFDALNKEMHETKDSNVRAAKAREMISKAGRDFLWWGDVEWACNQLSRDKYAEDGKMWYDYRRRQADLFGTQDWLSGIVPARERKSDKPYPGIDMKKMSPQKAGEYARRCWDNLQPGAARTNVVVEFYTSHPFGELVPDDVHWAHEIMRRHVGSDPKVVAKYPLDYVMKSLYSMKSRTYSWDVYLDPVRWGYMLGKLDEPVRRYRAWADGLEPVERYYAYMNLCRVEAYVRDKEGRLQWWRFLSNAQFMDLVPGMTAALKGVPDEQAGYLNLQFGDYWSWCWDILEKEKDEAKKKAYENVTLAFYDVGISRLLAGARNEEGYGRETRLWHRAMEAALEKKDAAALARVVRPASASIGWNYGWEYYVKLMERMRDGGYDEPLYVYATSMPQGLWNELVAAAAKFRTEVSERLPGVYPVDEKDPSYPLYVAADALARKNSERAWQILKEPRNQSVFEREILKLPPAFAIWGVEQLRLARGDKDALLLKARRIAASVLAQEGKVAPETAAAMILSTAEGYRDQQNFEAAKLEYQTLRENPVYHATKYGRQAMFRAVDLQIASGNLQGVEPTLEYWLSQNDREVQAQAHYFLAKIAFDRKDYDETIKQLRETFAISYTHTEGRFLHGQWKLATNSEVDDTDVPVGDLSERSMIRPGGQLAITVQDRNLSVAGGGASIPVVVVSEPSGDRETVGLYPTSRDPSVFKGVVDVRLGKACPSNRVVEVCGDDTVSYYIDPAFLKARGLPLNEPKRMKVIDDAKLAIGAGAPRTDESKTEKGLRDLLDGASDLSDSGVTDRLRPGNPLYVVVQDRDRSMGGEADSVSVRIETSSGDRIEGFALKEEKPFTGVFRGRVETSLPPPRAFASDTAAGMNPGDVINSKKKDGWKSLSDGQPGKWFAVDTMDSILFTSIEMKTPSAPDVNVLRLVGTLGQKTTVLGQFPAEPDVTRLYLRRQQEYDWNPQRSFAKLSGYYQTDRAPKSKAVEDGVRFRVIKQGERRWQTARFSGPFMAPKGMDVLRLRLVPASSERDAFRELWVSVAVDGEDVFTGSGERIQNAVMSCDVAPGCHRLEVAVVGCCDKDGFDLLWAPADGEPRPIPADWFDETKHPELKTFVKAVAKIERTSDGFKADFDRPERLRSFRWEFVDVRSPELSISSISATDSAGKAILPVENEFSSALLNDTLEVAPGDRITVSYEDERTTSGEKKVLQRQMSSSFNNARVRFVFEGLDETGRYLRAYDAFRFQPGDTLVLCVEDPDCDVTDKADSLEVEVKNAKGETLKKTLLETRPNWLGYGGDDTFGMHTGVFMGILKTCAEDDEEAPETTLRVASGDRLTLSYEDRENTEPGVPTVRTASIFAARPAEPKLSLFHVRKTREVDNSADAKARLERIRRRPGNENVSVVYRDVFEATPMADAEVAVTGAVPVNVAADVPIRVYDRSRARYAGSTVKVEAVARSERLAAEAEGREPEKVTLTLRLGADLRPFRLTKGWESEKEAAASGSFGGVLRLALGDAEVEVETASSRLAPRLRVTGSDVVELTVLGEDGQPAMEKSLQLVSNATLALTDSSFEAERASAHVGESFFVVVDDADRDVTDEPDRIDAEVASLKTGAKRPLALVETMPHSGVFTARLRPVMFAPGETIPNVATGGVASAHEVLTEDRFAVGYGDSVVFTYRDEVTLPGTASRTLCATGTVHRGSNGEVRLFSKRFADRDAEVLVQFRLAECLFEQAKEHRRLKQSDKASADIAEGRMILEEALRNNPDSAHVVQGEYLLANLYQELAAEAKEAGDEAKSSQLYQEALARFSQILGTWAEGEFAARSQYHKALCLEMLKDYDRASEEYVKMTYLYPESELVGEATIRLATYYYVQEKRYDIAGHIYRNFQQRFPQHEKAARALFMAGSCYVKQAETIQAEIDRRKEAKERPLAGGEGKVDGFYRDAEKTFDSLVDKYRDSAPAKLKAQALYWAGDVCVRRRDYVKAYRNLKRCVFEYPETEWARRARGLLLQQGNSFRGIDE